MKVLKINLIQGNIKQNNNKLNKIDYQQEPTIILE